MNIDGFFLIKMSEIAVLFNGYSTMSANDEMAANCTCTLIKGAHNIIVDTMTAWDSDKIISGVFTQLITKFCIKSAFSNYSKFLLWNTI